jgi:hypothetical protein
MKFSFAYFVPVPITWMSFASDVRELRGDILSILETHIVMSFLIFRPRPHRGDRFPRRSGFPAVGFYTHFDPRHLNDPRFSRRGSRLTRTSGEVQRTIETSSGRMVKCWISKIYLTNPSTKPSTFSHPI